MSITLWVLTPVLTKESTTQGLLFTNFTNGHFYTLLLAFHSSGQNWWAKRVNCYSVRAVWKKELNMSKEIYSNWRNPFWEKSLKTELLASGFLPDMTVKCKCGSYMLRRKNKENQHTFWGCRNYPHCRYVLNEEQAEEQVRLYNWVSSSNSIRTPTEEERQSTLDLILNGLV